jgi:hypothetical protein
VPRHAPLAGLSNVTLQVVPDIGHSSLVSAYMIADNVR